MDDLARSIESIRRDALAKMSLDELVEEHDFRLWYGPATDENMDRVEALGLAIGAKRGDLGSRLERAERKLNDHQSYLVLIGAIAVGQVLISHYGRETVVGWLPVLFVGSVLWLAITAFRKHRRRRALRRKLKL